MSARTRKRVDEPASRVWLFRTHWAAILSGLGVVAVMILLLYLDSRYRSNQHGPFRNEYQGEIVDKWAKYTGSETGSRSNFTLMVEQDDGKRWLPHN